MSSHFSPSTQIPQTGPSSSVNSLLLTPPITPRDNHDVPFRPTSEDDNSLNMKKKKQRRSHNSKKDGRRGRDLQERSPGNTSLGMGHPGSHTHSRSKIMAIMPDLSFTDVSPGSVEMVTGQQQAPTKRSRRWTLPSKSTATLKMTPMRSTVKQAAPVDNSKESPAMITLRRATTNKSFRRTGLTFFPQPVFDNERGGLITYLASAYNNKLNDPDKAAPLFCPTRTSRSASIDSDGAHPASTYPAATVCTETTVDADLNMPGLHINKVSSRRCSTKYVTGKTTYEVIWDKNDSLTTGESSWPSISDRRPSLAVMKLESQLARSNTGTRRSSAQTGYSYSIRSQASGETNYKQALTTEDLEQVNPKLLHQTQLRSLPRPRASGRRKSTVGFSRHVDSSVQQAVDGEQDRRASTFSIDFFPPLSSQEISRRGSTSSGLHEDESNALSAGAPGSHNPWFAQAEPSANASLDRRHSHLGSLLGASSHTRRRSSAFVDNVRRRKSTKHVPSTGTEEIIEGEELGTEPLLDRSKWT